MNDTKEARQVVEVIESSEPNDFNINEALDHLNNLVNLSNAEREFVSSQTIDCEVREREMCDFIATIAKYIEIETIHPDGETFEWHVPNDKFFEEVKFARS